MKTGMTPIVQNTTRLVTGFIAVFGIYVTATGHLSPGGGFAGGVILASAGVLVVLAFGRQAAASIVSEPRCHVWDAAGALGLLVVAALGYFAGGFFLNFINVLMDGGSGDRLHRLFSAGTVPLSNLAILVKVAAALVGGFLALSAFRGRGGYLDLEVRP